ncbi:MAG: hypothetical protein C0601_09370 [Candidatus Muiribacterium halophilum]|uniref:Uncharacterized protein n=1 Tax=Muiribacterium halophilum TaxID=2053465 RepID=A0A2N5ZDN8_MUIH1|nr:MAG: hypothetical protein C0601_09370 [Candidatus Muirbacterium halophilum]
MGSASQVHGGDTTWEPTTSCGAAKMFQPKGNFPFNCGYVGESSYTHFFWDNCETGKDTKMHGDIKKRYSVKEYKFFNIGHISPKESCKVKKSTPYSLGPPCAAHMNYNDWTADDKWWVETMKDKVEKEYKTTGEYEGSPISKDGEINFKGDFNEFMKSASRVVGTPSDLKEWPGDEKDTYISHGKLYLEGIVACGSANFPEDVEYRTPGMIISQGEMKTQKRISPGDKVQADSEEFFEQESILGLVAFGSIKDSSSKEQVGFYTDQKFQNSDIDIKGNIVINRLSSKDFGGRLVYGDKLNYSDVNIDDGKCMVITLSPIPSAYIVLNNVGGE